jgi:hypothetical protein
MGRYKYLEDKARAKGKKLLIENVALDVHPRNLEVFETPRIVESSDKKEFKARAIIRNVPVSKFTENLNGRIYSRDLDEKIIKDGFAEGTLSLADHPEDDGSITRICGVWHNPKMDEKFSYGDWYLVGDYGQLIAETVQAGGKIGVSRVGLGDMMEDGKTVNPETYELERYGDAVITPSQEVFATFEHIVEDSFSKFSENTPKIDSSFKEEITNNKQIELKEVKNMTEPTNKIQEIAFKNQIHRALKEAKRNENVLEAIEDLSALTLPETMVEEQRIVSDTISDLREKLSESQNKLQEKVQKTEMSFSDIKTKYEIQSKMLESLKGKFQKIDKVIKEHGLESIKDIDVLKESLANAVHDIQCFSEEKDAMLGDLKILMRERLDMLKDIKVFLHKTKLTEQEKKKLLRAIKKLTEDNRKNKRYILELERNLKKEGYKIIEEEDVEDDKDEDEKKESRRRALSQRRFKFLREEGDEDEDEVEIKEEEDSDDEDEKKESRRNRKGDFSHLREEGDEEEEDSDDEDEKKESRRKSLKSKSYRSFREEDDEEKEDEEIKEEEDSDEEEKEEAYRKRAVRKELEGFYTEQVKKFPGLKDFKNEIIKSRSFIEASKKIERLKESKQEQIKFSEAKIETSWIPKGRK